VARAAEFDRRGRLGRGVGLGHGVPIAALAMGAKESAWRRFGGQGRAGLLACAAR
jgi:hypothetical protein